MDEKIVSSDSQEFELQFRRLMLGVHTSIPGIIVSFDGKFATVQPAIKMQITIDGVATFLNLPTIDNVPVVLQYAQRAALVQTLPISPGDECLLVFSQRAIDNFVTFGGIQPPLLTENQATTKGRNHDLTDAICIPGLMTAAHLIPNYSLVAIETRNVAGTTVLRVETGEISATVDDAVFSLSSSGFSVTVGETAFSISESGIFMNGNTDINGNLAVDGNGDLTGALLAETVTSLS